MAKNPLSSKGGQARDTALALVRKKKQELLAKRLVRGTGSSQGGKKNLVLSDEAAKAIARAISGMLKK
ncbi:MAG: hypothetical protein JW768_07510 [Chitinispirillaceae bacterium]|nr:hypothetical protein [Chitinispirillaceae bacterium]